MAISLDELNVSEFERSQYQLQSSSLVSPDPWNEIRNHKKVGH